MSSCLVCGYLSPSSDDALSWIYVRTSAGLWSVLDGPTAPASRRGEIVIDLSPIDSVDARRSDFALVFAMAPRLGARAN